MRAIGLRPGFRRTGASSLGSIAMAAAVGTVSGHYIFKAPLEEYWTEENARQAEIAAAASASAEGSGGVGGAGAGAAAVSGGAGAGAKNGGKPSTATAATTTTTDSKSS
jgi:hypothetical protein